MEAARVNLADTNFRLKLYEDLKNTSAQRKEELFIRRFAVQRDAARLAELEAQLAQYTLTAPIDGKVLRSNIRVGEFAAAGVLRDPLMVLGNVDPLYVRVQIDETQASQIYADALASGTVRGMPSKEIRLSFVRKEPLIIPKRSLSGDPGNAQIHGCLRLSIVLIIPQIIFLWVSRWMFLFLLLLHKSLYCQWCKTIGLAQHLV